MCLRNSDLNIKTKNKCYLTHPNRNEDIDDVLLDSANQIELTKKDLIAWTTSPRSWLFFEQEPEPEVSDFLKEFERCDYSRCA